MEHEIEKFYSCVNKNADRYIRELQILCRQPSVSLQNMGVAETAEMVIGLLDRIGCRVWTFSIEGSNPIVVGEVGEGRRRLMAYNHYDVQPPEPLGKWGTGPFAASIRGGKLYARGAADGKGSLIARVAAVEAYQKVFKILPLRLVFVFDGEQEIGSPHLEAFVEKNKDNLKADACLWESGFKDAEGRHTISLGLKGYCAMELRVEGAATEMHSSWGTIVENPGWRLIWALGTLQSKDHQITLDGLQDYIASPSELELEFLRKMGFNEDRLKKTHGINHFINDLSGIELLQKHFYQPSLTICGFNSGYAGPGVKTVLPNSATAKLEFRLVPDLTPRITMDLLRSHLDRRGFEDVEIIPRGGMRPAKPSFDESIVRVAQEAGRQIYGHDPVIYPILSGSGPMYPLCQGLGIPVVSVGVGHAGSHVHAPNENIRITDFVQGIKYIGLLLDQFAAS